MLLFLILVYNLTCLQKFDMLGKTYISCVVPSISSNIAQSSSLLIFDLHFFVISRKRQRNRPLILSSVHLMLRKLMGGCSHIIYIRHYIPLFSRTVQKKSNFRNVSNPLPYVSTLIPTTLLYNELHVDTDAIDPFIGTFN